MNTSLTIYKEITYVKTFDWDEYELNASIEAVKNLMRWEDKFLDLWWVLINKSSIKEIYCKKPNEIENFLLNIENRELRKKVKEEVRKREKQEMKINLQILQNICERCQTQVI